MVPTLPAPEAGQASRTFDLSGDDLAHIARARAGVPLPIDLAHKLAEIVAAALRGEHIEVLRTADTEPIAKRDATLVARAAIAGFELAKQADGSWVAARWGRFRTLGGAQEVETFLRVAGVDS